MDVVATEELVALARGSGGIDEDMPEDLPAARFAGRQHHVVAPRSDVVDRAQFGLLPLDAVARRRIAEHPPGSWHTLPGRHQIFHPVANFDDGLVVGPGLVPHLVPPLMLCDVVPFADVAFPRAVADDRLLPRLARAMEGQLDSPAGLDEALIDEELLLETDIERIGFTRARKAAVEADHGDETHQDYTESQSKRHSHPQA